MLKHLQTELLSGIPFVYKLEVPKSQLDLKELNCSAFPISFMCDHALFMAIDCSTTAICFYNRNVKYLLDDTLFSECQFAIWRCF